MNAIMLFFVQGTAFILISFALLACSFFVLLAASIITGSHLLNFVTTELFKKGFVVYACAILVFICIGFMVLLAKGIGAMA